MTRLPCLLIALAACAAVSSPATARPVEHVIHVSVDGLSGRLLEELVEDDDLAVSYPNFRRLRDEGVWTFNARTDYFNTTTLPNHISMITGRQVLRHAGQPVDIHHGYVGNTTPPSGETIHNGGNATVEYVMSVFDVVHDHGGTPGLYASKGKFVLLNRSYNSVHGAPDLVPPDDGPDKIDRYIMMSDGSPSSAAPMHAAFISEMPTWRFDYAFVHYRDPDTAGHHDGWGSPLWYESVQRVDGFLGDLLTLIENDENLRGRTTLIVSTDHGGTTTGHADPDLATNYTIPFFVWGPGVATNRELYSLNPDRADPGGARSPYTDERPAIRNGDGANLALRLLGLPFIEGSTIGVDHPLLVRSACDGDLDFDGSVGFLDLLDVISAWGPCVACPQDLDMSGAVDLPDLLLVLSRWGPCR